jgi:hypothetical protein
MPTPPNAEHQRVLNEYAEQVQQVAELLRFHSRQISRMTSRMYEWDTDAWYHHQIDHMYGVIDALQAISQQLTEAAAQIAIERHEADEEIQFPF